MRCVLVLIPDNATESLPLPSVEVLDVTEWTYERDPLELGGQARWKITATPQPTPPVNPYMSVGGVVPEPSPSYQAMPIQSYPTMVEDDAVVNITTCPNINLNLDTHDSREAVFNMMNYNAEAIARAIEGTPVKPRRTLRRRRKPK